MSKLALLLKKKAPLNVSDHKNRDAPPAKRQKKLAASQPGSKGTPRSASAAATAAAAAAAAAAGHRQPKPWLQQPPAAAGDGGASDAEDDGLGPDAAAAAYSELVGLLSKQRTALGAALKQRQLQEQEGLSEDEVSEEEQEVEAQQKDSDDEDAGGWSSGTEDGEDEAAAAADHAAAAASNGDRERAGESELEEHQQAAGHTAAGGSGNGRSRQQQQQQEEVDIGAASEAAAAAAAAEQGAGGGSGDSSSSAATTHWEAFMSRELSESEVVGLRGGGRGSWCDLPAGQDPSEGLWKRARWQVSGRPGMPAAPCSLAAYGVKERLIARWHEVHKADWERLSSQAAPNTASSSSSVKAPRIKPGVDDFTSPQQRLLFALCDSYADVFYGAKPYPGGPGWSAAVPDEAMDAVLLHVLNHCAKTADVIKKNNDRMKDQGQGGDAPVPRDQGFTRPKALILLPMRNMAFQLVRRLVALAQKETRADSVQGKEKFLEQFIGDDNDDDSGQQQQQGDDAAAAAGGGKKKGPPKPAEHRALFRGNLDDHFRLGIRITRGQIKLFADLLQSDIIVASPVGLATKLAEDAAATAAAAAGGGGRGGRGGKGSGPKGASAAAGSGPGGEADFLSSIEVCVIERADVMLMQNWQHVVTVLEALNQLPKQQHGSDIMRVRLHLLASQGGLYRQTIITSSFAAPQLNAAFGSLCSSHAGKFRLLAQPAGVLSQVVPQVRQLFERFAAPSAAAAADARFEFFKASVWPRLAEAGGGGLLLVVPSYFDFVRLRNFLKSEEADYAVLSEYCSFSAVTRARALFFQRRAKLLLYTERAHFYHRYRIRGIQDIVFYGLPDHGHFYSELVNLVQAGGAAAAGHHATVTTLFCQFDALALSRVVGHSRGAKMLAADSTPTFVFC